LSAKNHQNMLDRQVEDGLRMQADRRRFAENRDEFRRTSERNRMNSPPLMDQPQYSGITHRPKRQEPQFAEPTFTQMSTLATKGMIIAKVSGADISWRQAFAPIVLLAKLWGLALGAFLVFLLVIGIWMAFDGELGRAIIRQQQAEAASVAKKEQEKQENIRWNQRVAEENAARAEAQQKNLDELRARSQVIPPVTSQNATQRYWQEQRQKEARLHQLQAERIRSGRPFKSREELELDNWYRNLQTQNDIRNGYRGR
jgi:hypothetical protein